MKVIRMGEPQIIMSNPMSRHNYFAWPTAARLQNGKIAVAASGFRLRHVCMFGKTVIAYSENDGETYTAPAPVIDTVLDNRDGGITPFGKSGVIVTSFSNPLSLHRERGKLSPYEAEYLDSISPEEEKEVLGSSFRLSRDCGVTFGKLFLAPVTSPHGPVEMPDGTLLWVGRIYDPSDIDRLRCDRIEAHRINEDGTTAFVGAIDNIEEDGHPLVSCEPHAIVLSDGTLLVHIRAQSKDEFTIFQSKSTDGGKSFSRPVRILPKNGGAPAHLFMHSSGMLICTYGYREKPCAIKAMFSKDGGETWDTGNDVYVNGVSWDLGYPSTVELSDGSLLTVFYARMGEDEPAVIAQQKWRFEENEI